MSYYPIHEAHQLDRYYYPHYTPHLHSELANIHRIQITKSQAEIDFLYHSNIQINQIQNRRRLYENVTRQNVQRQMQLAKAIQSEKIDNQLQKLRIRQSIIDEQLFRNSQLKKYNEQDHLLKNAYNNFFDQSKNAFKYNGVDRYRHLEHKERGNLEGKDGQDYGYNDRSINNGEILNFKPRQYESDVKNNRTSALEDDSLLYRPKDYKTEIKNRLKDISYSQIDKNNEQERPEKSILKSNRNRINSTLKKSKKVKFIEGVNSSNDRSNKDDSNPGDILKSKDKVICLNNSKIKQAYRERKTNKSSNKSLQNSNKKVSSSVNGDKRIQNRLKLSSMVYKDSQYRNIKHEITHLINTYELETNVRAELKRKFNEHPKIIAKFSIMNAQ